MIKQKRIEQGLTQAQLAGKAGVTKNYVTMVERGARAGNWLVRVALAEALDLSPLAVLAPDEIPAYRLVDKAIAVEQAEGFVWGIERCLEARGAGEEIAPGGGKVGALLAIRTLIREHPEKRKRLEYIRSQLNTLYPTKGKTSRKK